MSIFEYDQELHMKNLKEEYREEGKEEGREEGIVIGKEEGIVIGKEEGIVIGEKKGIIKGTVKTLKKMQTPENTIIAEIMAEFQLPEDEAVGFVQGAATKLHA